MVGRNPKHPPGTRTVARHMNVDVAISVVSPLLIQGATTRETSSAIKTVLVGILDAHR